MSLKFVTHIDLSAASSFRKSHIRQQISLSKINSIVYVCVRGITHRPGIIDSNGSGNREHTSKDCIVGDGKLRLKFFRIHDNTKRLREIWNGSRNERSIRR